MIDEKFVILGALLTSLGTLGYLIDTLKGKTQPNKVSWLIWAIAPFIAFTAQIQQDVGLRSLLTFTAGFNPLVIFLASFVNKKSSWKLVRLDLICGVLAVLGLLLWQITRVGNVAILLSILADGLAAVPTIVKSYKYPETESYLIYFLSVLSAGITLLTIKDWNFETFGFPLYLFLICLILFILIYFKIGKAKKQMLEEKLKWVNEELGKK